MKIKLTFLLAIFAMASFSVNAQNQTVVAVTEIEAVVVGSPESRVEITADQLPEAVHKTLKSETYKDWTISKAYHLKVEAEDGTSTEHYEVVLNSNDRETTLKLDKDGNLIE